MGLFINGRVAGKYNSASYAFEGNLATFTAEVDIDKGEQLNHYLGDGAALVVQNNNQAPPVQVVI